MGNHKSLAFSFFLETLNPGLWDFQMEQFFTMEPMNFDKEAGQGKSTQSGKIVSDPCHEHLPCGLSRGQEPTDLDLGSQENIKPGVCLVGQIPHSTSNNSSQ